MKFGLLGPLRVLHRDGRSVTPRAQKVRQLLALLVILGNQVVGMDTIIEELWGEQPPRTATVTAQTYISHIRKAMAEADPGRRGRDILLTVSPGYLLATDVDQVDVATFSTLLDRGRTFLELDRPHEAARDLRQALDLFRGPPFADVDAGTVLQSHKVRLEEERVFALTLRMQADLALGRHRELIGELKSLIVSRPLDESAHGLLIEALLAAGRRGEALDAYQRLRTLLDSELGLAPSPEIQRLQQQILVIGQPGRDYVSEIEDSPQGSSA
jgi:DNA-binding SARP family transcriptional activator